MVKEIEMKVKGKFFIKHNEASSVNYYWSQPAQNATEPHTT